MLQVTRDRNGKLFGKGASVALTYGGRLVDAVVLSIDVNNQTFTQPGCYVKLRTVQGQQDIEQPSFRLEAITQGTSVDAQLEFIEAVVKESHIVPPALTESAYIQNELALFRETLDTSRLIKIAAACLRAYQLPVGQV